MQGRSSLISGYGPGADIIEKSMGSRSELPRYLVKISIMKFNAFSPERNNTVGYASNFFKFRLILNLIGLSRKPH